MKTYTVTSPVFWGGMYIRPGEHFDTPDNEVPGSVWVLTHVNVRVDGKGRRRSKRATPDDQHIDRQHYEAVQEQLKDQRIARASELGITIRK